MARTPPVARRQQCPSLVFFDRAWRYCVPEAGIKYKWQLPSCAILANSRGILANSYSMS
jgi:hypothetical protein